MEAEITTRWRGRVWLVTLLLVAMTVGAALSESWLAVGSVLGTALAAVLVQIAPSVLLGVIPFATAALLAALGAQWPAATAAILRTEVIGIVMGLLVRRGLPPLVAILGGALPLVLPGVMRFLSDGGTGLFAPDAKVVDQLVTEVIGHYRRLNIPEEQLAQSTAILREAASLVLTVAPAIRFIGLLGVLFMIYLVCQSLFVRLGFTIRPIGHFPLWRLSHWYVWALAAGLVALLLPAEALQFAGKNILVVMVAAYFIQGLSVTQCLMVRRGVGAFMRFVVYTTAVLAIFPFFAAMTTGIGLFDTWFDFRGLEPREEPPVAEREDDDEGTWG
ncbi:MAG: DUF2232 domain-containing protein [bacterium]